MDSFKGKLSAGLASARSSMEEARTKGMTKLVEEKVASSGLSEGVAKLKEKAALELEKVSEKKAALSNSLHMLGSSLPKGLTRVESAEPEIGSECPAAPSVVTWTVDGEARGRRDLERHRAEDLEPRGVRIISDGKIQGAKARRRHCAPERKAERELPNAPQVLHARGADDLCKLHGVHVVASTSVTRSPTRKSGPASGPERTKSSTSTASPRSHQPPGDCSG